ncbi:MAG: OadG family protein [Helicobacteraceae bacterium]
MEINMLDEALKFMVLGMSTVFGFLIFMVFFLKLQGKLILKYASKQGSAQEAPLQTSAQSKNNMRAAVLSAAIMHHQKLNKR